MLSLIRFTLPLITLIPLNVNIKVEKFYQINAFRLIEENDGLKVYIKIKVINKNNKLYEGEINLYNNNKVTLIEKYSHELNCDYFEFTSKNIPYISFSDENAFIENKINIDYLPSQENITSLRYFPCKEENKHLIINENKNNIFQTTKYIQESYDLDDEKYNFTYFDRIKFLNYKDLYFKEGYSEFDISYINFIFENGKDNNLIGEFNFYLFDTYNLFPRFPYLKDTMFKIFPLNVYKINDTYKFSFQELYYNPDTFEMSPYYIDGYKYSEYLYFPIDKFNELKNINAKIKMEINSRMNFDITANMEISFNKELIGDCDTSEYCTEIIDEDINDVSEEYYYYL